MNALFTMLLLACVTTTFAAWLVVALRRPAAQLSHRFLSLSRTTQTALVFAVGVATAAAQKSGTAVDASHTEVRRHAASNVALPDATSATLANTAESVLAMSSQGRCLTSNDVARGHALAETRTNETATYEMPSDGTVVGTWHLTGAHDDVVRVPFAAADAGIHACGTSLWAHAWGKVRPQLCDSAHEIVAIGCPMSVVPGEGRLWTATTAKGSILLTWENFTIGRRRVSKSSGDAAPAVSAQIEFFPDGGFVTRSNGVERVYRRINPDDWDDDGIENEKDDDPLVAAGTPAFGPNQTLPDDANASAYYWVDIVVPHANAKVTFAGDGASNLADPTFVAKAGETNRVTLLVGKEYHATCALPFEVVGKSSASIEVSRPDSRRAEICWPVSVALADGPGASFGMAVSPSSLVGTFFWTNSCCGVSKKDDSFSFLCADGDCRCTGCSAIGFFRYEGFRIACVGGTCGCLPGGGPPQEAEPASVSVSFSKGAVIFEDEYDNSPTERVGWRSTETVLRCSASGGGNGGFLYVSLEGSDRLVRQGGPSLPYSKALAADETVAFECRYRATKASDAADDIKVTATLAENETGATRSAEATATAIRLTFTPEVEAPKNTSVGRHRYGVCEIVNCFQHPAAPKVAWQTTGCAAIGDARFRFPPTAVENPICASCRGETYIPALSVVEPSGVEGRAEDVVLYGVATNHAGGVGMQLGIYVLPGEVSFSGLMVEEMPCDRGSHGGYFDNAFFSGIWTHSSDNGAGRWWNVSVIDNRMGGEAMVDTVAIMSELPRINSAGEHTDDLQCSWSDGYIEWEIPFGWNAVDGEQAPCREFATDTRHRLEIDAGGTVRIQKLANEVVREISGKVLLNGERRDR